MDKMEDWEVNDIIENLPYLDKNLCEMIRLNMYATVQVQSKKKLKPNDLIKFPWEEGFVNVAETTISKEDIKRLKNKAEQISKNLKLK